MKKSFYTIALFLIANIALPKEKKLVIMTHPCWKAYDNSMNWYTTHGYSACEAQEVCSAAVIQCLRQ